MDMIAFAVFLFLALVGTRGCGQRGAPGAPEPAPPTTPASTAAAATEVPPTATQLHYENQTLWPVNVQRMKREEMPSELPRRKFTSMNSAGLQGRVGTPTEEYKEDITQERQIDTGMEQDGSLKHSAATPEQQPGPIEGLSITNHREAYYIRMNRSQDKKDGMLSEENEEDITQKRQSDTEMEQDGSLKMPAATPQQQPGSVTRFTVTNYREDYYIRNNQSGDKKNQLAAAQYAGTRGEMLPPLRDSDVAPPPPEDLYDELDRVFGVQDYRVLLPELKQCPGLLKVASSGRIVNLEFSMYVECHPHACECPPHTVPSTVDIPFTVRTWKEIPYHRVVETLFNRMGGRQHWTRPVGIELPNACHCLPVDYKPRKKQ